MVLEGEHRYMTNKVTTARATGIKCPYTGRTLDVYLTVVNGSVLYSCPDAFTPSEPVDSLETLQDRASMRKGVAGLADGVKEPVCAYTGKPLRLVMTPDGKYCYVGGFNPRRAFPDLDKFLYYLTMRNGVASRELPSDKPVAEKPAPLAKELPGAVTKPSDDTLVAMENLAAQHMERATQVSMSSGPSKRGKKSSKGK